MRDPGFSVSEQLTPDERERRIKGAIDRSQAFYENAIRCEELTASGRVRTVEEEKELEQIISKAESFVQRFGEISQDQKTVRVSNDLQRGEELGLIRIGSLPPGLILDMRRYISDIARELSNSDAYGVLDEEIAGRAMVLSDSQIGKQRVTQVAAEMFRRLPLFEQASFDEIRDMKIELRKYLDNFRQGIVRVSKQIRSQPWGEDFPHEVEIELRNQLLPAVAALEDQVESNSYLKQLLHKAAEKPLLLPATSTFGLLLSTTFHSGTVASQVASAVAGGGLLAFEAYEEWKQANKRAEENQFFFYFKAGKMLAQKDRVRS